MTRRPTFSEIAWPDGADDAALAVQWAQDVATQILDWTWRAFDALRSKHLSRLDLTQPLEQLERDLVRNHFVEIQVLFSRENEGYSAFIPLHEWPELETGSSAQAKPPAYDLAFVSMSDRRWAWPIEAKVLRSPNALAEYLQDVNGKFVPGVASPLIGEGGMIGYLLCNEEKTVFRNLEKRLGQTLSSFPHFADRPHRVSRHSRIKAPELRLHHMIMMCVD